jgi:creatinine amidohydrolase/Fe(II)-dependent formamide hydrolase-like protein
MTHSPLTPFLPDRLNTGPWLAGYSLPELRQRAAAGQRMVLPICSLGTPPAQLAALAPLVLPPLYHEALDTELKAAVLTQVHRCFPFFTGTRERRESSARFDVVELPPIRAIPPARPPRVLAFSIDTAVEQHGPHLPLATDTIQSYGVLQRLAAEVEGFALGPPVDYGHLTWGLPFGFSIDLTPPLVARYVERFVNALVEWMAPEAVYVVDVHGSHVHRAMIEQGLRASRCARWAFRWLYDSLLPFTADRGDQHAGGVETALVELIAPQLVDPAWWPGRVEDLAAGQMTLAQAVALSGDLSLFVREVEGGSFNGIVGDVRNYFHVNAAELLARMLTVARGDVQRLLAGA